jgi:radical SAM-linked protein
MIYRPVRERKPAEVVGAVVRALEHSGHDEVSLTALSTADVSCISPLIRELVDKIAPERVSLSVASLRAYGLADDLLDEMRRVRAGGLTFAPEAGTQRMRDVINKNVTEEQLLETAERVFSKGFDTMKLYFMIGLPTEEDADVLGIIQVAKNALAVADRLGRKRAKITISVSTHVPKPHTPFQWCAMDTLPEVRRKQTLLRQALGRDRRLTLRCHDSTTTFLEGIFARGDRRLADVLERAFLNGACFDSWEDQLRLSVWQEAFTHYGIVPDTYLGTLPVTARLPWDHFDIGLEQGFLAREYRKALQNRLSPPCGKAAGMFIHHTNVAEARSDERRLVCYDCGVACDMSRMREERIGFLEQMGALAPSVKQPRHQLPLLQAAAPDSAEAAERERPRQPGERHERWRLSFEKIGPAALLGHLDFMRELGRVIRRAGLRPVYSQGFHPKPRYSFGPALGLGIASLDEKIDVDLIDPPEREVVLQRLNAVSGAGLRFVAADRFDTDTLALGAAVYGARYLLLFAESALPRVELEAKIAAFLQREKTIVRRSVKGVGRLIDVRSKVKALRIGDAADRARAAEAGLAGRLTCVVVDVDLGPAGSVKPHEIVEALLGDTGIPHQAIRDAILLGPATSTKPAAGDGGFDPALHAAFEHSLSRPELPASAPS